MKRVALLLLPMLWWITAVLPAQANPGGPSAAWAGRGGLTMNNGGTTFAAPAAPAFTGAARAPAPNGRPALGGVNRGLVSTGPVVNGGLGYRGSPVVTPAGPAGVSGRFSPISAGARSGGTVAPPRPNAGFRPFPPGAGTGAANLPLARPPRPLATMTVPPANLGNGGFRQRPNVGNTLPSSRVQRPRLGPAYVYHPQHPSYPHGLKPGHYVPGETYVQNTVGSSYGQYPYGFGPNFYLGGAFPFFYGTPYASTGVYLGTGTGYAGVDGYYATPDPVNPPLPEAAGSPLPPEVAPGSAPVPPGASNPALAGPNSLVEAVQMELLRRGYFAGRPDGYFNRDTAEALRRFQGNHGLARTGLVNEATLYALGLN